MLVAARSQLEIQGWKIIIGNCIYILELNAAI